MTNNNFLLEVNGLKKYFPIKKGIFNRTSAHVKAVDDIHFQVFKGETLGIVGESGCGKSTTGRLIIRLLEPTEGVIKFEGQDITHFSKGKMRNLRKDMQMVFQDPYSSLNPRLTIGEIIEEPLINFHLYSTSERKQKAYNILEAVGLREEHYYRYPHEFSGGQRQRIGIARALMLNPKLIIADEPVSALDVSIQSQILNILKKLQKQFGLTYIFISHDLSVVKHFCDRVAVMYLGRMVEITPKPELYKDPLHPYSKALLSAVPIPDPEYKKERIILKGDVPSPSNPPTGCAFHPRCPDCMKICENITPSLQTLSDGRMVACHLYENTV
jgi:oligopeptide/dipeptide ABC transporter ATP-binding protein